MPFALAISPQCVFTLVSHFQAIADACRSVIKMARSLPALLFSQCCY